MKKGLITVGSILIIVVICLRVAGEFRSCAGPGKEYVYNETVTLAYLSHDPRFEDTYKRFCENGIYLTAWEYAQESAGKEFPPKNRLAGDIEFLTQDFQQAQADLDAQTPSAEAAAFHKMLETYYHTILTDYLDALRAYAALDTNNDVQRDMLRGQVDSVYNRICDVQTEMLRVQVEYGKRVGLKLEKKNP